MSGANFPHENPRKIGFVSLGCPKNLTDLNLSSRNFGRGLRNLQDFPGR